MNNPDLKLYVDLKLPGVARIVGDTTMAGMLLGVRCRRIVACVNACEGLSTAALETAGERPLRALIDAAINTNQYCRESHAGEGDLFEAVRALDEDPA